MTSKPIVLRDTGGYTLVELVTVLVLAMLITGLAVPSMGAFVERQKTRGALDQVAADLAYARALAVRSGEPAVVVFDAAGDYLIRVEETPPQVAKQVALSEEYPGIALTLPTASRTLTFDRRGLIRDVGSGAIVASMHDSRDTLSITATGRVYRGY